MLTRKRAKLLTRRAFVLSKQLKTVTLNLQNLNQRQQISSLKTSAIETPDFSRSIASKEFTGISFIEKENAETIG